MKVDWTRAIGLTAAVAVACLAGGQLAQARPSRAAAAPAASEGCTLGANGNPIKHVIYLQFDNVHYRRDAAGVPSDLEQMPHLLHFLEGNGTLFTNDHTILISHTAGGILSSLTGEYPDRNGQTVTNSYGFFKSDGTVGFSSAFKYWTDQVDATADPLPNMITDGQKTTPAPWVPFTRAGCDVGGVGTANIELENTSTNATGDMTRVFGANSPEWNEASAAAALPSTPENAKAKGQPLTDFVGIAVHCGNAASSLCSNNPNARPDALPDEPGGYSGYQALFGARYVDPAITANQPCVPDTAGQPITDAAGTCGFPGFDGMLARNTLGYVEQMQEHGVPVTYGYISDVHDAHAPNPATDSYASTATGPGEAAHDAQLKDYDDAFQAFFQNLAAHGIDKSNTLFAITVDEGDHFTGGAGIPQPDGTLQYAHTACATLDACPSNQIGEVNANLQAILPAGEPAFSIHSDDAPDRLRERTSRADRSRRPEARAGRRGPEGARPLCRRRDRARPDDGQHGGSGRGADAPHGERGPEQDADVHPVRQRRLLLHDLGSVLRQPEPVRRRPPLRDPELRLEPRRRAAGDRQHVGRARGAGCAPRAVSTTAPGRITRTSARPSSRSPV